MTIPQPIGGVVRYGIGHRPAREGELCACGQPGQWTWLDHAGRACATTCPANHRPDEPARS